MSEKVSVEQDRASLLGLYLPVRNALAAGPRMLTQDIALRFGPVLEAASVGRPSVKQQVAWRLPSGQADAEEWNGAGASNRLKGGQERAEGTKQPSIRGLKQLHSCGRGMRVRKRASGKAW